MMKSFSSFITAATVAAVLSCSATSLLAIEAPPATAGIDWRGPDGSTALQWAVYDSDAQRVAQLLKNGADVSVANIYGATAMQLAAEVADISMLKLLLEAGADPDSANPEGQTALMLVARTGNVEAAKLLVKHGATVDAREQWGDQTALMWASARRHTDMVDYLISKGADPDARSRWRDYQRHLTAESRAKNMDSGGLTPLLYATRENCLSCVKALVKHGADINKADPDRVSPLLLAIMNTNWDIAKVLIEAGADVNKWDIFGQSPLYAIASRRTRHDRVANDPLNDTDGLTIAKMLLDRGANTNMQLFMRAADQRGPGESRGSTPLNSAAGSGDLELVQLLLEHGAKVNLFDADNETSLMMAVQSRNRANVVPIIQALHRAGIELNTNAMYNHLQRNRGGTALHYAVRAGNKRAIEELISLGADLDIKDPDGLTALDYAMARGYIPFLQMRQPPRPDLAEALRKGGAKVELDAEPTFWLPVGPPIGYEATIWPLSASLKSASYGEEASDTANLRE